MAKPNNPVFNQSRSLRSGKGFALVSTLMLMVLLSIIALGLLSLSSISIRASLHGDAKAEARANAKLALMLAIGELQETSGADQRITMTSGLGNGGEVASPNWTGVVDVSPGALTDDAKDAPVRWLVSGESPDPAMELTVSTETGQGNALKLGSYLSSSGEPSDLLAPLVENPGGRASGRYAWWIGDEGTKARVDLAGPDTAGSENPLRYARSQSPMETDIAAMGGSWAPFSRDSDEDIDRSKIVSLPSVSIATQDSEILGDYFNDVTIGGHGIPVDVRDGGMKVDLSLVFDESQVSKDFGERYFGATPSQKSVGNSGTEASIYDFSIETPAKFFLSDAISKDGSLETGPNWGQLWNYATIWRNVDGDESPSVGVDPQLSSDLRFKTWLPYTNNDGGKFRQDLQHTNSPLTPVLSLFQISFRLSSEAVAPASGQGQPEEYKAQITMQPVIGFWNPHNVAIKANPYVIRWALYPYFRLSFGKPTGAGTYTDRKFTELWLRERWVSGIGGGLVPTPEDPLDSRFISVTTEAVDLQPGEFRVFSALEKVSNVDVNDSYKLKPGWSENGGFVVDLQAEDGSDQLIPRGHRAWVGDIYLQDTQSAETSARFPKLDMESVSSSWISIGTQGRNFLRTTEIWNNDGDPAVNVPEPVVSGWNGVSTTKPTYLIEDLADGQTAAHIATWAFFIRNTNQVEEESQRLRGWIDSNPRAMVTNPLWDGSRVESSGNRVGWHTSSPLVGAYNPPGQPKVVGDGAGGNRGMLAEGGIAIPEPEVNPAGGRYQGFGGAATTFAGGKTNVILFDVPRSPLVSIGQFQHAQLNRYNFEPGFVVGNSYANPRIPLDSTINRDFNDIAGFDVTDISYDVNSKLWDGYFFSTLGLDYIGASGSFDSNFDADDLASQQTPLPNPRMVFAPLAGDSSIDGVIDEVGERAPEAIAARIRIKGAFNVNSVSKPAWKAVLSTMGASDLPTLDAETNSVSWNTPAGVRFNRFGHVLTDEAYEKNDSGDEDSFWQGWRKISGAELDELAEAIVEEVKERGPFRSMAEFVNRNPDASKSEHQLKGGLQAALDRTINNDLPASVGKPAIQPDGDHFSQAITTESTAAGQASYLTQGDVLQSLAPILQVRSDYFRIRTCGEALDSEGKVVARAWCEAFVQRNSEYLDKRDEAHESPEDLTVETNRKFGRRYEIVSFRWLSKSEI